MSYCRFAENSDVYAYECDGGVQFWVSRKGLDRLCNTFCEAYMYAKELRDKYGLSVPDTALEELRDDAAEEVTRIIGVTEELYAENVKLRELCVDFVSMLTYAGLDGLRVEATIGGITKTYDASELFDKVEEIWDKED
jgi:hypothetical protein